MAIVPTTQFPGAVDNSDPAGYPLGKAQNDSSPGSNDGTPLVAVWVNDLWGFMQALLANASIAASGTADKVGASQYLDAILASAARATRYVPSTVATTSATVGSGDHMKFITFTNAAANTVTVSAPVAPYGDTVTLEKATGAGNITLSGAVGVTVEVAAGATNVVSIDGKVASLVSKGPNLWKLIT